VHGDTARLLFLNLDLHRHCVSVSEDCPAAKLTAWKPSAAGVAGVGAAPLTATVATVLAHCSGPGTL
jgi:hypothetical protein